MYKVITSKGFDKQISKLDNTVKIRILKYLQQLEQLEQPQIKGKALTSNLNGLWRYRIGDYRVICEINSTELIILALEIGHRRDIYR